MKKMHLFSKNIDPACAYCKLGATAKDGLSILCARRGVCSPGDSCSKFIYAPLKRVPRRPRPMMDFDPSDFEL